MAIEGIDQITFGVEDMARCHDFMRDWGLALAGSDADEQRWETLNGAAVVLRRADDPSLPPAIEDGSTIREVIWGVESEADLDALRPILSTLPGFTEADGVLRATDPNGLGVGFALSSKRPVDLAPSVVNAWGSNGRVDMPSTVYDRATPVEIGHYVLFTRNLEEASAFYLSLGFHLSDEYPGHGKFLRCAARGGHHDLFLLETPEKRHGLNHVAFAVRDIHEVFGGGLHVSRCGWSTQLGPGRHPISSAYFWYFHNPAGGLIEYYTDEDYLTEAWVPRSIEPGPTKFAEWAITGGIDGNTRRQSQAGAATRAFLTE
jgi:catechol 2,3-dioxygenase-like lactoylglutathione lyase family enzyme